MEETKILELFLQRDPRAIEESEKNYGSRLRRLAYNFLKNREDAEECVNDTFLKAWEVIPPASPNSLYAYLAKICRNITLNKLDYLNAQKRGCNVCELTVEMEQCIPNRMEETKAKERELSELLANFLDRLPKEKRIIFVRRYWYGYSISEIANASGVSESKVKTMLCRIRKNLRRYLEEEGFA